MSSLDHLNAGDLYLPAGDFPRISWSDTVSDAILLMRHRIVGGQRYRSILIFGPDDELLGYVSLRELLWALDPQYLRNSRFPRRSYIPLDPDHDGAASLSYIWQDQLSRKVRLAAQAPVNQVMTPFEASVTLTDPIAKCVHLLLSNNLYLLPVVESGQLQGMLRLVDLFDQVAVFLAAQNQAEAG